jgi:exopolyphosphatase / guanosine-5'-triphosphate,3'-diphosphate pyrophosphatase
MKVAVVDVGANTIRLLVAEEIGGELRPVRERKERVGLGAEVEAASRISAAKIVEAAGAVAEFAHEARRLGCARIQVIAASPGRQAENAGKLVRALASAAQAPVRVLSPEEEALLAYFGALHRARPETESVAVCDVGGGSTQVVVGTSTGPFWVRSIDIGSLRLTTRAFGVDQPGKEQIEAARLEVRELFEGFSPPLPQSALAVGGTARALRKLCGPTLGEDEFAAALRILRKRPADEIAKEFRIDRGRVATLAAGAVILAEVQHRLVVPLQVTPGGLREGLALELLAEQPAA